MYKYTSICIALCAISCGIISSSLAQDASSVAPGTSTSAVDPCGALSINGCESCVSSSPTPCSYVLTNDVISRNDKWVCKTAADLIFHFKLILNNTEDCSQVYVTSTTSLPPDTTTNPTTTTSSTTTSTTTPEPTTLAPETTSPTSTTPTTSPTTSPTTPPTSTTTAPPTPIPTNATTLPPPPITTVVPISTTSRTSTTAAPHTDERHFDAASFFGGFVLLLGLMSIAFLGLKFYRARTGRNYHTLEI